MEIPDPEHQPKEPWEEHIFMLYKLPSLYYSIIATENKLRYIFIFALFH